MFSSYKLKSLFIIFFFSLQSFCAFGDDDTEKFNRKLNLLVQTTKIRQLKCLLVIGNSVRQSHEQEHVTLATYLYGRGFETTQVFVSNTSELPDLIQDSYDIIILSAHGSRFFVNLGSQERYQDTISNLRITLTNHLTANGMFILSACGQNENIDDLDLGIGRVLARYLHSTQIVAYPLAVITNLVPRNDGGLRFINTHREQVSMSIYNGYHYNNTQIAFCFILYYLATTAVFL